MKIRGSMKDSDTVWSVARVFIPRVRTGSLPSTYWTVKWMSYIIVALTGVDGTFSAAQS